MNKKYSEEYARLTLQFCGFNKDNFENINKPDLQNNIDGIGIEVTQAISSDEGYFINICNKYFGKNMSPKEFKQKADVKSDKFKGVVFDNPGPLTISRLSYSRGDSIEIIRERIIEKINLSEKYKKFQNLGLYIFALYVWPSQEIEMKKEIYKINICPFNFVIIMTSFNMFIFKDSKFESFKINDDERIIIHEKALEHSKRFKK